MGDQNQQLQFFARLSDPAIGLCGIRGGCLGLVSEAKPISNGKVKHMYAIEFKATIRNGMIPIPKQYLRILQSDLKVIVLQEDPVARKEPLTKKDDFFASVALHRFDLPQDYCFNRKELYDRLSS